MKHGHCSVLRAAAGARALAAAASIATTLVLMGPSPAHAQVSDPNPISFTVASIPGGTPGAYTISYRVTNTSSSDYESQQLVNLYLPELSSGDLTFDPVALPEGWSAKEYQAGTGSPNAAGAYVYGAVTPFYVDLQFGGDGDGIDGEGDSLTFLANVPRRNTVVAQFAADFDVYIDDESAGSPSATYDPLVVGPAQTTSSVPEPSTLTAFGIGGLMALLAVRRRRAVA